MFVDLSELAMVDIIPNERTMSRVYDEDVCGLCSTPPLDGAASATQTFAWLEAHEPVEAMTARAEFIEAENETNLGVLAYSLEGWRKRRQIFAHDSKLYPRIAVSLEELESTLAIIGPIDEEALADVFLTQICDRCSADRNSSMEDLMKIAVARFGEGNEAAALRQPGWEIAERFIQAVAAARLRSAS
jgi:hypothetical protein